MGGRETDIRLKACTTISEFIPVVNREPLKDYIKENQFKAGAPSCDHAAGWEEGMKQLALDRVESQEVFMRISARVQKHSQISSDAFP